MSRLRLVGNGVEHVLFMEIDSKFRTEPISVRITTTNISYSRVVKKNRVLLQNELVGAASPSYPIKLRDVVSIAEPRQEITGAG